MSSLPHILVTGANGQLGKELRAIATSFPDFEFVFLSREDLPIHHFPLVRNFFHTLKPAYCINAAAYTAVDRAEQEKELAFQVNAEAVGVLAEVCREYSTHFIHISTDYVFNGKGNSPYLPDDPTDPQSVYGASKQKGEELAIKNNPDSIILRTSWVYSEFGKNFVKTMIQLMKERESISVVSDQIGSPTYAADLAEAMLNIIRQTERNKKNWHPGIYHFSNEGVLSWYDFAVAIRDHIGSNCKVQPIPTSAYPTPAARPAYSVLDKTSFVKGFGISLKPWNLSLKHCLDKLTANS